MSESAAQPLEEAGVRAITLGAGFFSTSIAFVGFNYGVLLPGNNASQPAAKRIAGCMCRLINHI